MSFVIDGAVGHHLQSLSLVLGEGSLPQDQMTKQVPPRAGGKRVQITSLLQLCERRLLLGPETGHCLTSAASKRWSLRYSGTHERPR